MVSIYFKIAYLKHFSMFVFHQRLKMNDVAQSITLPLTITTLLFLIAGIAIEDIFTCILSAIVLFASVGLYFWSNTIHSKEEYIANE